MALEEFSIPARIAGDHNIKDYLSKMAEDDFDIRPAGTIIYGSGYYDGIALDMFDFLETIGCPFVYVVSGDDDIPNKIMFDGKDSRIIECDRDGVPVFRLDVMNSLFDTVVRLSM